MLKPHVHPSAGLRHQLCSTWPWLACGPQRQSHVKDVSTARQAAYRIDMDDTAGEVMMLRYQAKGNHAYSASAAAVSTISAGHDHGHSFQHSHNSSQQMLQAAPGAASAAELWAPFADTVSHEQLLQAEDSAFINGSTSYQSKAALQHADSAPHRAQPHTSLHMSVYRVSEQRLVGRQEFVDSHRLVSLQNNPYVPLPADAAIESGSAKRWKHQVYCLHCTHFLCLCLSSYTEDAHPFLGAADHNLQTMRL